VTPVKPYFLIETAYENEHSIQPAQVRAQTYFTAAFRRFRPYLRQLSIWNFDARLPPHFCTLVDWKTQLSNKGSVHMRNVAALFGPRAWYNLVPDRSHTTVTAGFGIFGQFNYVNSGRTADER